MIKMIIADSQPIFREGLRAVLAADSHIAIAGEASSGEEVVVRARELRPDVVLMDLRMSSGGGADTVARILDDRPETRVVVLTGAADDRDIFGAIAAGAAGYLLKETSAIELLAAIFTVVEGGTVLAPPVATKLVSRMSMPDMQSLTPREAEVLSLVAKGLSNAEIGRSLIIGESTVKTHLNRIFGKLDVSGRTAAVTTAMRWGLIESSAG
ncbi:response regulator transcription factor [Microbispora sp. NPDC088329]|uniref:response regulator transcription factor n=1 Tax=Microbispora sp. NPDC088329 TaxID=3154869 RepID=UPI003427E9D8